MSLENSPISLSPSASFSPHLTGTQSSCAQAAGSAGFQLQELTVLAGDRHVGHSSTLGEGEGEGGGEGEEGDEEREKKKEGEDGAKRGEDEGDKAGHKTDTERTDKDSGVPASTDAKKKSLSALKLGKAEGKREGGGILKLGAGKKHKQTLTQIIPDRAHAIALAEAVVKNANAAAAAAAATRLDVPGGATIGLHQSHQAAHSDPSGTPKSRILLPLLTAVLYHHSYL